MLLCYSCDYNYGAASVSVTYTEEFNYYQIGILPSFFYTALTSKDLGAFKDVLWKMGILVISVCIVSPSNLPCGSVLVP